MTINGEPVAEIDIRASYLTIFLHYVASSFLMVIRMNFPASGQSTAMQ